YAASVIATLKQFGLKHLSLALEAVNGVHEVWDLLLLEHNLHTYFNTLGLWFESTGESNRYKICFFNVEIGQFIHLISKRPETFGSGHAAPDPKLLALHAMCAQVVHMSGAAKFLDELEWKAEETNVLAFDGSSVHLLSNLMSPYTVIPGVA
ncbi:hypothetical protein BDM02DRAFT_3227296, partial [Thelephora ganbajun]